jgi:methionyl-tRNA formyltransferase
VTGAPGAGRARRWRTVFAGSGTFAVPILERLLEAADAAGIEPVGVVSAPARPAGRGGRPTETPIVAAARSLGVPAIVTPNRLRAPQAISDVLALEPDLLVVADYGQIVPPALLDAPRGALNVHPSRLPRHRGATPIPATILAGDPDTAVTVIRMDPGLDTGPIVAVSEPITVPGGATTPDLEERLALVGAELLVRTLPAWLNGAIRTVEQPTEGASLTRPLRREDGRLDPSEPAFVLERQVRAYQPWPGAFLVTTGGERVAVLGAALAPSTPGDRGGRLVAQDDGLALATADGRLVLLEVQPPGGRPMPAAALLRGRRGLLGAVVTGPDATMADR